MLKQFRRYLDNPGAVYLLITGYIIAALLQGLAFVALIPFLRAFLGPDPASAIPALWVLVGLGAASFLVNWISLSLAMRISVIDVCGNLISKIGRQVSALPLGWFRAGSAGDVAAASSSEVDILSHLSSVVLPNLTSAIVVPSTVLVSTFFFDWRLALVMVVSLPFIYLVWRGGLRAMQQEHAQEPKLSAASASRLIEYAQLQPVLRARGLAGMQWAPIRNILDAEDRGVRKLLKLQGPPMGSLMVITHAIFAGVLAFGLGFALNGSLDLATFVAVVVMTTRFVTPMSQALLYQAEIQKCEVSLDAIGQILDSPVMPQPEHPQVPENHDIDFQDIAFAYDEDTPLFRDFSLKAPQGQITAVVGPSGCGKSTLTKLAARFWDVSAGRVTIGGVDVKDIATEQLMSMISMVFQDVYLFDTTIRENVRIAKPGATDDEVDEAIRRARLEGALARLPQGLDTPVGEGGTRLSGGERQRVSIARAFLKDAPILLLDEVTSALDAENEAVLTATLGELSAGRTVVVIAHRLSTIMRAHSVAVLSGREAGETTRVVQQGSPTELAEVEGMFAELLEDSHAISRWRLA
mgnify:FL=1